jgi:DNA-binding response OmpR family regulator
MYLQAHGHTLAHCADPRQALPHLAEHEVDVILLDVNMPHMSGVDLCVLIRAQYDLPLIMLTERAELADRVLGLELGADDYLAKPFEPLELVSRIKAVVKRYQRSLERETPQQTSQKMTSTSDQSAPRSTQYTHHSSHASPQIRVGDVSLDLGRREARLRGDLLPLSTIEWNTLKILMNKPGIVFSRDEIISLLHGAEVDLVTRSVDITVSRLRTHLGDDSKSPTFIKTVWGAGYTFLPQET